jgi:RNA polymerase sigma-70 factor (ECF subfamily)
MDRTLPGASPPVLRMRLLLAAVRSVMNSTDVQLLSRIAAGDQQAFGEFYDRQSSLVLGLLVRLLGNRADADDALQDVFWQVWRSAGQYDSQRASPKAWLCLIARSRATDRLRRRARQPARSVAEPVAFADPAQNLEQSESAVHVREALGELPEAQRSAICLAFYGGRSYDAVAREQQVPVGTIKTRIRLGMQQLRGILRRKLEVSGP